MKIYSLPIKLMVCGALVCSTFALNLTPSYGQGRTLTTKQIDTIVNPTVAQCSAPATTTKNARLDPASIIPTANAREFPVDRVARTMHGMWRGQVIGDPTDSRYDRNSEANVDYFWIIDTVAGEGLIIAIRNGNSSTIGLEPVAGAPKISYLICPHDGYIPSAERGAEIHEFTKVSDSTDDAPRILQNATGLSFRRGQALSDMWQTIVGSGYFTSLPAVAFAGGLFKPMRLENVSSPNGPAQFSMSWDSEYYGGGTTGIKFTPGVPMRGVEYTQFVGTTGSGGDYLIASPGNGKLAKVEAMVGGHYDLAFDVAAFGPLQTATATEIPSVPAQTKGSLKNQHRTAKKKNSHSRSGR
ncbi:MAG TPA: hypothetical protein VI306_02805 [Pyrinomonadaceae bacterium]